MAKKYVVYVRVSTNRQGESGLGLDAQRDAAKRFIGTDGTVIAELKEVESGKRHKNRPQLLTALELCRRHRATLVIAKLDRLGRNVAFISALMESSVEFVCCDNPHATRLMLHMLAAFAEHEREVISQRTRAALAGVKTQLKACGSRISLKGRVYTKLGGPDPLAALRLANLARNLTPLAAHLLELIAQRRHEGRSLRAIAAELNASDIRSSGGSRWYASTVNGVLSRLSEITNERNNAITIPSYDEIVPQGCSRLNEENTRAMPCSAISSARRETTEPRQVPMFNLNEANRMLDTFASVGAAHFDVTFTDLEGQKRGFRPHQSVRQLRNSLPQLVPGLEERQQNIIVRPSCEKYQIIQLDDLNDEQLKPLAAVSFLILETSPGNHQAWLAVSGADDARDFARRLRKGTEADATASGATRVAGTVNYKKKYEAAFPTVKILQAAPGRTTTAQQLEALGLVAAPEPVAAATPLRVLSDNGRKWPDYEASLRGAPMNNSKTGPDVSRADFFFSMLCSQRGWSVEETAARLMELSSKAQENGQRYAEITAENAAAACDRQRRGRA